MERIDMGQEFNDMEPSPYAGGLCGIVCGAGSGTNCGTGCEGAEGKSCGWGCH